MIEKFLPVGRFDFRCGKRSDPLLLLSGPPSSGKTSLVFQFAINSATGSDGNVVFICNRRKLETKPPYLAQVNFGDPLRPFSYLFLILGSLFWAIFQYNFSKQTPSLAGRDDFQGIDPSSDVIHRIKMKYMDDEEGIKKYFAAFHIHDPAPVSVIIDDFADFFNEGNCQERYNNTRGRDLAMVRVLALCRNAILYANEKGPCELLLSDTHNGDSPRFLYIYKRWVSSIYTIKGDGFGSYLIRSGNSLCVAKSARTKLAKYSIALQYLVYEGIIEDEAQSDE